MPIAYVEGAEEMAVEFWEMQLKVEKDPKTRKELAAAISKVKEKRTNGAKGDFIVGDTDGITST